MLNLALSGCVLVNWQQLRVALGLPLRRGESLQNQYSEVNVSLLAD